MTTMDVNFDNAGSVLILMGVSALDIILFSLRIAGVGIHLFHYCSSARL